jgi:hypothetical protein
VSLILSCHQQGADSTHDADIEHRSVQNATPHSKK